MKLNYIQIYVILTILQLNPINSIDSYHCGFGELKPTKRTFVQMESNKRNLDSNTYETIRIYIDTNELDTQVSTYGQTTINIVRNALENAVKDYKGLLKVIPLSKFQLDATADALYKSCGVSSFNNDILGDGIDTDMVIFPIISLELGSSTIAASQSCINVESSKRPVAGFILINPNYISTVENGVLYLKNTLFHELAHIFVFDPNLFQIFGKVGQKTLNSNTYYTIASSKVLEKARKHFNCDSLDGVLLENQGASGSAGAHWEARIMLGDYMISTNYIENAISEITLALFEDSGWYQVNYYTGGLFRFGKGRGCSFIQQKCIVDRNTNFPNEFCVSQQGPRCTNNRLFYGSCYLGNFHSGIPASNQYFGSSKFGGFKAADYCPIAYDSPASSLYGTSCVFGYEQYDDVEELGETIGKNSICVISNLRPENYLDQLSDYTSYRAICHQMTCDFKNKQTIFTIGDKNVICPKNGGVLKYPSGFTGFFECPEFNIVCTSETYCTDISDCISKKSIVADSTYTFDYSFRNNKIVEDTTYLVVNGSN